MERVRNSVPRLLIPSELDVPRDRKARPESGAPSEPSLVARAMCVSTLVSAVPEPDASPSEVDLRLAVWPCAPSEDVRVPCWQVWAHGCPGS